MGPWKNYYTFVHMYVVKCYFALSSSFLEFDVTHLPATQSNLLKKPIQQVYRKQMMISLNNSHSVLISLSLPL